MRLVDEHDRIGWKKVEQSVRRRPGLATVEVARIVLDSVAVADLAHHLEVEVDALLEALGFQELVLGLETRDLGIAFNQDLVDDRLHPLPRRDIVRRGKHGNPHRLIENLARQGVHQADPKGSIRRIRSTVSPKNSTRVTISSSLG